MIRNILTLLRSDDWANSGDLVQIAKGRDYLPLSFGQVKRKIQRLCRLKKR